MAIGSTDIANHALDLIGETPLSDLDEGTTLAARCKRSFERCRDELQREHPWKQFILRAQPPKDTTAPLWGYANRYALPAETMRLLDVFSGDTPVLNFQLEGDYILTDYDPPLSIRYIKRNTDVSKWDPLFNRALAYRIAIDLIESITQSTGKKQELRAGYDDAMAEASRANAMESRITIVNSPGNLEQVRVSGVGAIGGRY